MIFEHINIANVGQQKIYDEDKYIKVSEIFELNDIKELVYHNNLTICKEIISSDRYFFSDIAAALFRKMFERNLTNPKTTIDALLSCSYHIQKSGYSFLGFIKKDDEIGCEDNDEIAFFKRWDFTNNDYADRKCNANEVFDKKTLTNNCINVFFVAGTQNFETLNLRIKRASILISKLLNEELLDPDKTKIILSGRNNAFAEDIKVNYSNESITMKNLITYRLSCYTGNKIKDDFFQKNVHLEMNSRNSIENIIEMIDLIKTFAKQNQHPNLFIISSTAHLLQLNEQVKKHVIQNNPELVDNIFLVGSENPKHNFGVFYSDYIKYLINEIVYRNSKDKLFID